MMGKIVRPFAVANRPPALERQPQTAPYAPARMLAEERERPVRILVVDDDSELLEDLADALHDPTFAVHTAGTADTFYRKFEDLCPDAIITDLAMPAQDGTDILRWLQARDYSGMVILMSGCDRHVLETTRRMAVSYGLNIGGTLAKPFAPEQLAALTRPSLGLASGSPRTEAALAARRISPYFQPKIDLKTSKIVGAEALSRWMDPNKGLLMPQSYLNTSGSAGIQSLHDLTILERALEFCGKLNATGHQIVIAVNFTIDVILDDYFIDVVTDALQRHEIAPQQLMIELTEHGVVESYDGVVERLLKLRLAGVQLSLDDFGTGYSTLSRIQKLPVSEIKIDRSFVSGLTEYSENFSIVRSIIDLAHSLHCTVVAEGVETSETLEALNTLGCDQAQGYLFSPAVNEATFVALVRDNAASELDTER